MAKVGCSVVDPKAGAYCQITLDSGEKILVNHDTSGFKGGTLSISGSEVRVLHARPMESDPWGSLGIPTFLDRASSSPTRISRTYTSISIDTTFGPEMSG